MNFQSMQKAIQKTVQRQGEQLKKATPTAIAISLASASLLPLILGSSLDASPALSILRELGVATLADFVANFIDRLREKYGDKKFEEKKVFSDLENELTELWKLNDDQSSAIRRDTSILLKAAQAVDIAIKFSSDEIKIALTQGFGDLGKNFQEFGWILDEINTALEEVRLQQTIQLATQKEQLELQREQLTKTNLLLKIQREATKKGTIFQEIAEIKAPADLPCPYKGLAPYQPQDTQDFAGRDELAMNIIARLAGANFLGVVGPSGSGKSSLVRAGVVPLLWTEGQLETHAWQTLITTPGAHPLEELAVRLSLLTGISPGSLIEDLKRDTKTLRLAVRQFFASDSTDAGLCIIVDQFEEIFTLCRDEAERSAYIEAILSIITLAQLPVKLMIILRADFYGHCAQFPELAKLLSNNQTLVGQMREAEYREAILLPAERVGLQLESGLVELLLEEIHGEAGALPMLSHALQETWKLRRGNLLTVEGYLETGGIRGAIAETAETIYQSLPEKSQEIARQIFLRLAEIEDEYLATSRPSLLEEFFTDTEQDDAIREILEQLTQARLLTMDDEKVAVAHEALFSQWPTLAAWLQADIEGLRIHRHLTKAALDWQKRGQDQSDLYRGARLAQAREWSKNNSAHLSALEKEFLRQGHSYENLRRRRVTIGAAILILIFGLITSLAVYQGRNAKNSEATAIAYLEEVQKQRDLALAHQWGATGQFLLDSNGKGPLISALLGVESLGMARTLEGDQILREVLQMFPKLIVSTNHGWHVNEIKFFPGGDFVAIATYSDTGKGTCKVLDTFTGEEISVMEFDGEVYDVDVSPSGDKVVCGGSDGIAKVWDPFSGTEISRMDHSEAVNTVAFSPDGKSVLSGSEDGRAVLWEIISGKIISHQEHISSVSKVEFSDDGNIAISGGGNLLIWEASTGKTLLDIPEHLSGAAIVAASPNNNVIASAGNPFHGIRIWDLEHKEEVFHFEKTTSIHDLRFSDDGNLLISGDDDGNVQIWDLSTGEEKQTFSHFGDLGWVNTVDFQDQNSWVISGSNDSTARVWDATTGEELFRIFESSSVYDVAFSPDGKYAVTGGLDGSLRIWELKGWDGATASKDFETRVLDVKFDPSGQLILLGDGDGHVRIWNLITGEDTQWTAHLEGRVNSIAISKNGRFILSGGSDGFARLWDSQNEFVGIKIEHASVLDVAFSPTHRIAASGGCDWNWRGNCMHGYVKIWDITDGEITAQYSHDDYVTSIDFSPDGSRLISGSRDGTIIIWDMAKGEEISHITYDPENWGDVINSVAFHPNGEWIATGGLDGSIRIWDTTTLSEIIRINHEIDATSINFNEVNDISFSPDGKWIASGSNDHTVRVWSVETGEEIARMHHDREVTAVSFSPDGRTILSSSLDGTAKIWLWKSNDLIEKACERIVRNMTIYEWQQYIGNSTDFRETCPNPLFSEER